MARFSAGDTITDGTTWHRVEYVNKGHYKLTAPARPIYMPVALVDRLWRLADDNDVEIED